MGYNKKFYRFSNINTKVINLKTKGGILTWVCKSVHCIKIDEFSLDFWNLMLDAAVIKR